MSGEFSFKFTIINNFKVNIGRKINQHNEVVFLWNRTLVVFLDRLSCTTVDFIRSEGELCSISVCKRPVLKCSGGSLAKRPHLENRIETYPGVRKSAGGSCEMMMMLQM